MIVKPVLGDWEIPNIESIRSLESRSFVELPVPGKGGNLFQDMNAEPVRIAISGSLFGDEKRDTFLETLREKFTEGEPVTFVADIITATSVQYVVIEQLFIEENANVPDQTNYQLIIRESPPPPPSTSALGDLDAGLLDGVDGLLDSVTGALDVIDGIPSIPNLQDPTAPLADALNEVGAAVSELSGAVSAITDLFGGSD